MCKNKIIDFELSSEEKEQVDKEMKQFWEDLYEKVSNYLAQELENDETLIEFDRKHKESQEQFEKFIKSMSRYKTIKYLN